jgi:LL-diaminopimelate aminotransferase
MTGAALPRSPYVTGLPPYPFERLDVLRKEVEAKGINVIDLGMGEPREPTPELVKRALIDAIPERSPYPRASGLASLRRAASGWLRRRFGIDVDPDRELLPVNGTKEAVFNLPLAVQSPERPVMMIPDPAYPVYALSARAFGSELYRMPLRAENAFLPDLDAIPDDVWRSHGRHRSAGIF